MAQALAGIDPDTISLRRGPRNRHGARAIPIEIAGLTQAFRLVTEETGYCALGSVKTNIGHLDAAAGVTGLIKTALALHHRTLPADAPLRGAESRSSTWRARRSSSTPSCRPWPAAGRAAGAPASARSARAARTPTSCSRRRRPRRPRADARAEQLLLLSARSADALDRAAEMLRAHLAADPDIPLADVAYTLQVGRRRFDHRRAIVATSPRGRDRAPRVRASRGVSRASTDDSQRVPGRLPVPGPGCAAREHGPGSVRDRAGLPVAGRRVRRAPARASRHGPADPSSIRATRMPRPRRPS